MKTHKDIKGHVFRKRMGFSSILVRTALLSWLVSIVSICIFVFYVVPQQKQIFLDVLESKARVLASSIHDVAASAIVTEDYSQVVDHCMEIIRENSSVSYLVLTRQDGFSLVHTADGWRVENLDGIWRDGFGADAPPGAIRASDLVDYETYHYIASFDFSGINVSATDFSGIHWGLAHIGLSLDQYHAGVTTVYKRTAYVALLCALVGLIISLIYALRLVKPILLLEGTVQKVADGDLNARADVSSGDEVENLAHAFNQMTQSIQDREAVVRAQNLQLTALVTEKSLHDGNIIESARRICEASVDTLGIEEAGVWLWNEDQTKMECVTLFQQTERIHTQGAEYSIQKHEPYFDALSSTRVLAVNNAVDDPRTTCVAEDRMGAGTGAVLDSAIRIGGRVVGVICQQQTRAARRWTAEEENFTGSLSDLMALALEARDRRSSQEELLKAKEVAEAASQAKSRFLANMSHEIRTPLNGVVGMLKLLEGSPLNTKQTRFVHQGLLSSEALLMIINDVLDFSKIEAGRMEIENLPFNLVDVVENVTQMFAQSAEAKGLELASFVQTNVPEFVCGDAKRIGQILINLVSNAIKFTERGEVIIRVSPEKKKNQKHMIRFEVEDTGIGIALKKKERIFEAFLQEDSSTTRRFGGTGLGLGICRQLVELMGGQIHVESRPGAGSNFWFTIALGRSGEKSTGVLKRSGMQSLRALVVDDHPVNREILCYELINWDCAVEAVENGEAALVRMREFAAAGNPFEVAVIDWNMPGIDGEELGRRIKADPQLEDIKMILLCSVNEMNTVRLRDAGFSACIAKPARQSELYDAIMNAINNVPDDALTRAAEADSPETEMGRGNIRILLAEDNEINQEVAVEILKMSGYHCDVVENGQKAVEAAESGKYDLLFMDCMMPELDGYEATRRIRGKEKGSGRRLPIIALTANAMKGDREKCLESGMDDYLSKPLDPEETAGMVEKWCKKTNPSSGTVLLPESEPEPVVFDREKLLARCMGNEGLVEKLIAKFLTQLSEDLKMLEGGLSDEDPDKVVHSAHRMKGAAANLSLERLSQMAAVIEQCARAGDLAGAAETLRDFRAEALHVRQYFSAMAQA